MSEKPILMSGVSVRAILEDRKWKTRRVIKFKEPREDCGWCYGRGYEHIDCMNELSGYDYRQPCRCCWPEARYAVGDVLWVKETWRVMGVYPDNAQVQIQYRAGGLVGHNGVEDWAKYLTADTVKWRPAIFMPKWAARLWLRVTDVRVERVQDISEEDILAEGVRLLCNPDKSPLLRLTGKYPPCDYLRERVNEADQWTPEDLLRAEWASLWDSINGKKFPWESNPWVRVYTFERKERGDNDTPSTS